jgi:hypothetical protein
LDEEHWAVDGPSGCLVPSGRTGPFRPGLRFNAAVDRLTGAAERHSVACLEFRPGAGLWTLVRFADQRARDRWLDPVKTSFRLLADSGFGGERSLGWGRAEMPEFVEGAFPDMILASEVQQVGQALPEVGQAILSPTNELEQRLSADVGQALSHASSEQSTASEMEQTPPPANADQSTASEVGQALPPANAEQSPAPETTEPFAPAHIEHATEVLPPDPETPIPDAVTPETPVSEPAPGPRPPAPHWLLSLFTPASTDSIDWTRGNYTVLIRGGRVEAPSRSGDLKRQLQMVAEGSVLYAASAPRGSAPDVAPAGFAHPVFRAGFAVSIPLPEPAGAGQTGQGTAPSAAKVS